MGRFIVPEKTWPEIVIPEEVKTYIGEKKEINLAEEILDRNVKEGRGRKVAVYFEDRRVTYRDLYRLSNRIANFLKGVGVEKYDRVGFRTRNMPEAIAVNFGIMKAGAIPVPLNPMWTGKEVAFVSNNAEIKALFVSGDERTFRAVEEAKNEMKTVQTMVVLDGEKDGFVSFSEVTSESARFDPIPLKIGSPALVLYTSGTTGLPKGCVHFVENVISSVYLVGKHVWKLTPDDVVGGPAPVSFAMGYGNGCLIPYFHGAAASIWPRFSVENFFRFVEDHGITIFSSLPTSYRMILADPGLEEYLGKYDISSLRLFTGGGEALGAETARKWKEVFGMDIYESLGATEMLHICIANACAPVPVAGSIGFPVPGYIAKVVDTETGKECQPGEVGSLYIKGPTGIRYWNHPSRNLEEKQVKSVKNGWNILGDFVRKDENGYIYFVSRDDDLIKSSGYRIGPDEIEHPLSQHPAVAECAVIGVPDPEGIRGQVVKAIVRLKEGYQADERLKEDILVFLEKHIAKYKLPRIIEFTDRPLPRTPTGKIIRRLLRQ
ncbi:AMP-binding protein [Geoglobus acetivorans]|uniref:Acyl-CoA synthetase n=1 Tax=Geoglobus acetivorans TaxID=565033 RepID=A0ABZ3H6D8_GEOAI|nr:acyl-CoA synthetase [Geoglobus acetivorans]